MANEISLTGSLSVYKPSVMSSAVARSITGLLKSQSGNGLVENGISVATTATALPLGGVTQPHWAYFCNLDATNYVTVFNGASGAVFLRLYPGEAAFCPLDPGCVPYATANTAAVWLEYMIAQL